MEDLCNEAAAKFGQLFRAADQPLLNIVLHDAFGRLDHRFSIGLSPRDPPLREIGAVIYHFVRSPKPWDLAGGFWRWQPGL